MARVCVRASETHAEAGVSHTSVSELQIVVLSQRESLEELIILRTRSNLVRSNGIKSIEHVCFARRARDPREKANSNWKRKGILFIFRTVCR